MAQLNSSPILNVSSGGRVDTPVAGPSGSKTGATPQDFAHMMAGAIQSRSAAQSSASASPGAPAAPVSAKGDHLNQVQDLIKGLQQKIKEILSQHTLPGDVSSGLSALEQQLLSLQQKLAGSPSMLSSADGRTAIEALVTRLQKLQAVLSQNGAFDSAWMAQLQGIAIGLNPDLPRAANGVDVDAATQGRGDPLNAARLSSAESAQTTSGRAQAVPGSAQTFSGSGGGATTLSSNGASASADTNTLMHVASGNGDGSGRPQASNSLNNLVQASALLSGHLNAKGDGGLSPLLNTEASGSSMSLPGINASGAGPSGFGFTAMQAGNSVFTALPSVLDLNHPKVADNMGQQIQWMVGKNISRATLELNPAQLGPLKITIDMQQNQTHIQVLAAHHLTRDVLEQNLPRLRDFLQEAGLAGAQVSIGQEGAQGQNARQETAADAGGQAGAGRGAAQGAADTAEPDTVLGSAMGPLTPVTTTWRLDTFA